MVSIGVDELVSSDQSGCISIRGEAGTGKSVLTSAVCSHMLEAGRTAATWTTGSAAAVKQLLNQMSAFELNPYRHLLSGDLTVAEGSLEELAQTAADRLLADVDILAIDVHAQASDEEIEALHSRVVGPRGLAGKTTIVVAADGTPPDRRADVVITLGRNAIEVERGLCDAVVACHRAGGNSAEWLLTIGDRTISLKRREP